MTTGDKVKFKDGFMPKHDFIIASVNDKYCLNGGHIAVVELHFKAGKRTAIFRNEPQENLEAEG